MIRRPPRSTLFPTRRSSDLQREGCAPRAEALLRFAAVGRIGLLLELSHARPWFQRRQARERSEEHTSELQSQSNLVCRLLLEKKKKTRHHHASCTHHARATH